MAGTEERASRQGAGFRVYRVDRFAAVEATGERFTRDETFDLPAFWAERAAEFTRSLLRAGVVVRLSEEGVRQLPYVTDRVAAGEAVDGAGPPDARAG